MPDTTPTDAGASPDSAGAPPDLTDPAVIAAIDAAVEARVAGLRSNNQDLKTEKTAAADRVAAYAVFGTTEELAAQKARLAELEHAASAAAAETTPDKFQEELDRRMARERELLTEQRALVDKERDDRERELEERATKAEAAESKTWFLSKITAATGGEGWREGAAERIYVDLEPYMVRVDTPAGPDIRFRVGDRDIPGSGPDRLMPLEQLLGLPAETQKTTIPKFDSTWYQADHGSGSGTRKPEAAGAKRLADMTEKERIVEINRDPEAYKRRLRAA